MRPAPSSDRRPPRPIATLILAALVVGGLVMAVARLFLSRDPAAALASMLGLGSGVILGALVGGLFGCWLVLGQAKRIAATVGFFAGILVVVAAWRLAEPYLWVVDVVMNAVVGAGGDQYSGIVVLFFGFLAFRIVQRAATGLAAGLLARAS